MNMLLVVKERDKVGMNKAPMIETQLKNKNQQKSELLTGPLLTEANEQLLVQHFDGETSWFANFRAQRLLKNSVEAREFVDTLKVIGEIARNERAGILATNDKPVDLWSRISARIDEEERVSLYLGNRVQAQRVESKVRFFDFLSFDRLAWGLSGGMVAAGFTYFMVQSTALTARANVAMIVDKVQKSDSANISAVSFSPRQAARRKVRFDDPPVPIQLAQSRIPSAVEVDWVKSDGRVSVMQEPSERSAIIWVKKRSPVNFGSDRKGLSDEPVVVYNDRIPQSIPVGNFGQSRR